MHRYNVPVLLAPAPLTASIKVTIYKYSTVLVPSTSTVRVLVLVLYSCTRPQNRLFWLWAVGCGLWAVQYSYGTSTVQVLYSKPYSLNLYCTGTGTCRDWAKSTSTQYEYVIQYYGYLKSTVQYMATGIILPVLVRVRVYCRVVVVGGPIQYTCTVRVPVYCTRYTRTVQY